MFCLVTAFDNNQSDAGSSVGSVAPLFLSKNYLDIDNASDLDNASSEISELGTPRQGRDGSAGPSMEHSILDPNLIEPLQKSMKKKVDSGRESDIAGDKVPENNTDRRFLRGDGAEHLPEPDHGKMDGHVRRLSIESIGSDLSSVRASEISNLGIASLFGDGLYDLPESAEASRTLDSLSSDLQFHKDLIILFLSDERHKLKRVLNTLQRRLATAKTDMEDLISRLNQEVAVRHFLVTKVFSTIVGM